MKILQILYLRSIAVLSNETKKLIVIPNEREQELLNLKDPLSRDSFSKSEWKYLLYSDIDKLSEQKKPTLETFLKGIDATRE